MKNEYDGVVHTYVRKRGVVYEEVMLPPNAPAEWQDREKLWNAVELSEKAKDSRLAREFNAALPVELTLEEWIPMLQDFIQKNFVDLGMQRFTMNPSSSKKKKLTFLLNFGKKSGRNAATYGRSIVMICSMSCKMTANTMPMNDTNRQSGQSIRLCMTM